MPTTKSRPNWIHIDLKGAIPDAASLRDWARFFAECGFNGIVWEYEDRLPWQTFPDTFRPGYDLEQWKSIWKTCGDHGLTIVPLVQTLGHLEWLLKHPAYAHLRENDCWNEWCPLHPEVPDRIKAWLDELIASHPRLSYVHLGGDETWNLATCPRCQAAAAKDADGAMGLYVGHLKRVAQTALQRGLRPLIWADMFWREKRMDLAERLPRETVFVDWRYRGAGPWESVQQLGAAGHAVFGASGIRDSFDLRQAIAPLGRGAKNIRGWQAQREQLAGLIHTTWGRSRSLRPPYGPWEGWLPAFRLAGGITAPEDIDLYSWVPKLDTAMADPEPEASLALAAELKTVACNNSREERCHQWWVLALRLRHLYLRSLAVAMAHQQSKSVYDSVGLPPDAVLHARIRLGQCRDEVQRWSDEVRQFFASGRWNGVEEYLQSRTAHLLALLDAPDWTAGIVPEGPPRSRK